MIDLLAALVVWLGIIVCVRTARVAYANTRQESIEAAKGLLSAALAFVVAILITLVGGEIRQW